MELCPFLATLLLTQKNLVLGVTVNFLTAPVSKLVTIGVLEAVTMKRSYYL